MKESLQQTFFNPPDEFTPIPFWFWNYSLDEKEIVRQIEDFCGKGVMGFVIHPRMGIPKEIPYLSDSYMHYVKFAVEEAAARHMKVVLYDEAMYPSGSAHGLVVENNPEYATRALFLQEYGIEDFILNEQGQYHISPKLEKNETLVSVQMAEKDENGLLIPGSVTELSVTNEEVLFYLEKGKKQVILVLVAGYAQSTIRGIHMGEDDGEPLAPAAGDLLNPKAMEKFIQLTYDRYYEVLSDYFGTTIIAMFTDEPCVLGRCGKAGCFPWTEGFLEDWIDCGGKVTELPFLWQKSERIIQKKFKKAINKRLCESYYRQISTWCIQHGIALAGHPANSEDIGSLKYFQIPGQDLVWRWVAPENELGLCGDHSTMAKCSSDAARHTGRRRNSNECFGCCGLKGQGWTFTADDMKWYIDWLIVRGVNLLYPHAFYYSIEGELRYGERPPDVGPHNIWWQDYRLFSDYIKRMCWLMTDSVNTASIAVLCKENHLPWLLAKECFQRQIEFNYLEEDLILSGKCSFEKGYIKIASQKYRVLLIEEYDMLTEQIINILSPFVKEGGKVLCLNEGQTPAELISTLEMVKLGELSSYRDILLNGCARDIRVSHVVKEGQDFYLLTNEGEETYCGNVCVSNHKNHICIDSVQQKYRSVQLWYPWEGTNVCVPCEIDDQMITLKILLNRRESVIIVPDIEPHKNSMFDSCIQTETIHAQDLSWEIIDIVPSSHVKEAKGEVAPQIKEILLPGTDPLSSWTQWKTQNGRILDDFSGTVVYAAILHCPETKRGNNKRIYLDLGRVEEIAHLWINGLPVGVKMWKPYIFDITEFLTRDMNELKLTIDNCLANGLSGTRRMSGMMKEI